MRRRKLGEVIVKDLKDERSVTIKAPIADIYTYVADLKRHAEWNYQPQQMIQQTEGPIQVGTVFHTPEKLPEEMPWIMKNIMFPIMTAVLGMKSYTVAEVTALEPHTKIAWKAHLPMRNDKAFMRSEWVINLEETPDGTKLIQSYHYMAQHKMAEGALDGEMLGNGVAQNLNGLKAHFEKGSINA
jgi:hypothetical protein